MIITKIVKISCYGTNYSKLGYEKKDGFYNVKIEDLPKNSHKKIKVKCDICGNEKELSYRKYNKNISNGGYYSCSQKCSKDKKINTFNKNYGVDNPFQSEEIKEKIKETNSKKYGSEIYLKSDDYKIKNKKFLEKHGVDNIFQLEYVKEKSKETCLKKYGVENPTQSEEIKKKSKETCLKKYGVEYPMQNEKIYYKNLKNNYLKKNIYNLQYQGTYEYDFIDRYYNRYKIYNAKPINYIFEEKKKIYYPDFYLPDFNLIVEIKSLYTYKLHLKRNLLKKEACIKNRYNFLFIIDKSYKEIDYFINKKFNIYN
jgi:hypothetical protein